MIRGIKFSPTNTYFIALTSNTRIYKLAQGYYSSLQTLPKVANDAAFSEDESKIFLAETNGNFSIYQTNGASFSKTQEILASASPIL
jgi:Tol biopolymer transport system component